VTRPLTRQRGAVWGDDGAGDGGCCALAAAPITAPINRANIVCGGRDTLGIRTRFGSTNASDAAGIRAAPATEAVEASAVVFRTGSGP